MTDAQPISSRDDDTECGGCCNTESQTDETGWPEPALNAGKIGQGQTNSRAGRAAAVATQQPE